jgi:hypothetical protein
MSFKKRKNVIEEEDEDNHETKEMKPNKRPKIEMKNEDGDEEDDNNDDAEEDDKSNEEDNEEEEEKEQEDESEASSSDSDEEVTPKKEKRKKKEKKKTKKKEKKASSSKPSLKLQYTNGKRKHNEELLKYEKRLIILKNLWKLIHETWKCTSDKTIDNITELADEEKLLPIPFLPESESTWTAIDIKGMLNWKIIDPVDQYEISIFLVHSLGIPILKHVKMGPKQRAVIIIDNCPSSEKEQPKEFPKDTIILRAKMFLSDYMNHYYNQVSKIIALGTPQIQDLMQKTEQDITKYPVIWDDDINLIMHFGFHLPAMINTPQVSISCGIADYPRVVMSKRSSN